MNVPLRVIFANAFLCFLSQIYRWISLGVGLYCMPKKRAKWFTLGGGLCILAFLPKQFQQIAHIPYHRTYLLIKEGTEVKLEFLF